LNKNEKEYTSKFIGDGRQPEWREKFIFQISNEEHIDFYVKEGGLAGEKDVP